MTGGTKVIVLPSRWGPNRVLRVLVSGFIGAVVAYGAHRLGLSQFWSIVVGAVATGVVAAIWVRFHRQTT